jgi:hypothetical protein
MPAVTTTHPHSATTESEVMSQKLKVCRTPVAVGLAVLLPGLYLIWWQLRVTAELRAFGRHREDRSLSASGGFLAMTVGWVLIVPAMVHLVRTARRVQRCEQLAFEAAGSVRVVVAAVVGFELIALLTAVVAGGAIFIPVAILAAGVVEVAALQPRLNRLWRAEGPAVALDVPPVKSDRLPIVPPGLRAVERRWSAAVERRCGAAVERRLAACSGWRRGVVQVVIWVLGLGIAAWVTFAGLGIAVLVSFAVYEFARLLIAEDRTGAFTGALTTAVVIGTVTGLSLLVGSLLRCLLDGRATRAWGSRRSPDAAVVTVAALGLVVAPIWLWAARPVFHGALMPFYQWPLVTWIPIVLGLLFTAFCVPVGLALGRGAGASLRTGVLWRTPVTVGLWLVLLALWPGWQGHALYEATLYVPGALPVSTQPRLLPKAAAAAYAGDTSLHNPHLVIDPATGTLVWSAELTLGILRRGPSEGFATLPLDRVDGTERVQDGGFHLAVSRVGPGSLQWRAYDRHFFTRVQDAVIVPLPGGGAVAVAPYIGYRGFPVRHPYWAGVYVLHQDGRLEDLSPRQALARPELVASGRLFPERLARAIASAYGYRTGAGAVWGNRPRTEIGDASGNPQPYLTNLGGGQVDWVTVAHPAGNDGTVAAIFLTDASTGATTVWTPPPGQKFLSNTGAAALVRNLPLQWDGCCDDNGDPYWLRKVVEPTPVFANGRLYYLVSVIPNSQYLATPQPVDQTVIVDAEQSTIVGQYDHSDPSADADLRAFFNHGR